MIQSDASMAAVVAALVLLILGTSLTTFQSIFANRERVARGVRIPTESNNGDGIDLQSMFEEGLPHAELRLHLAEALQHLRELRFEVAVNRAVVQVERTVSSIAHVFNLGGIVLLLFVALAG